MKSKQRDVSTETADRSPGLSMACLGMAAGAVTGAVTILLWMEAYIATHPPEDFTPAFILMYGMPVAVVLGIALGGVTGFRSRRQASLAWRALAWLILAAVAVLVSLRVKILVF